MGGAGNDDHGAGAPAARGAESGVGSRRDGAGPVGRGCTGYARVYGAHAALRRGTRAACSRASAAPGHDGWADRLALLRMGWQIRKLGRRDMRELLRIGGMNVYDLLEENFDSAALKGALGFDAVLGANFGPRSPGTVLTLLYRLAAESAAGAAGCRSPRAAWAPCAMRWPRRPAAAGADIRTGSPVARFSSRATGPAASCSNRARASSAQAVISNADPKTTFLRLLGPRHLDTGFVRRVNHIRSRGLAAKLHLALNRVPPFSGVTEAALRGRLLIAPSLQHIEHAYNHAKYGEFSAAPVMEITVPTRQRSEPGAPGQHVLSAIVQYAPYALKEGWQADGSASWTRRWIRWSDSRPGCAAASSARSC